MSSLDNSVEWQVGYWIKMSHQRNFDDSSKYVRVNTKSEEISGTSTKMFSNEEQSKNVSGKVLLSFREDHKEFLNPLTKSWRESLRTWKQSSHKYTSSPRENNTDWLKKEKRKDSKKADVLQLMSK